MSGVPYLGCKISLVSKSEIRYEGILYTIDTKESTVALAKVRSYGTEGRPTDRPVAPRDEVYEYIIFRANDIKDLHVCEPPKSQVSVSSGLPNDPAIVQVFHSSPITCAVPYGQAPFGHICGMPFQHYPGQVPYSHISQTLLSSHSSGSRSGASSQASSRKSPTIDAGVQVPSVTSVVDKADSKIGSQSNVLSEVKEAVKPTSIITEGPRRGGGQGRRQPQRGRGVRRGRRGGRVAFTTVTVEPLKFDSEFDFEQAQAEFIELETKLAQSKIDEAKDEILAGGDTSEVVGYNKDKSFFDNISCEALRIEKGIPRFDWRVERKLNVETFGVAMSNTWLWRRRGRGGFRRGGRGRGNINNIIKADAPKAVRFGENQLVTIDAVEETPAIKETPADVSKPEEIVVEAEIVIEASPVSKEKVWEDTSEVAQSQWK